MAARGPLRVLAANPRYFTDGSGRAVYLTGSHTWDNRQDIGSHRFDWDGRDGRGDEMSSGVYFAKLASESTQTVTRLVKVP